MGQNPLQAYNAIEGGAERERVLMEQLPQVRYIARRIHERLPRHVPLEDLVHAGVVGLIDALNKFDQTKHVQFSSYAKFRIRGAILDSLRELDWSPRELRRKGRMIEQAYSRLSGRLGRAPSENELAKELTYNEVLAALEAQRRARYGKVGEWIEKLGFATQQDVTAALAIQWSCPIASSLKMEPIAPPHQLPLALLEAFHMWPQHFASSTNTLCLAFGERVDHGALYAIEKMLDCHTLPCVAGRKAIAQQLEHMRHEPSPNEIIRFGPLHDSAEMARIAGSYITKLDAEQVRLCRLGPFIWVRMRTRSLPVDVLFRLRSEPQHDAIPFRLMIPPPLERIESYWDSGAVK